MVLPSFASLLIYSASIATGAQCLVALPPRRILSNYSIDVQEDGVAQLESFRAKSGKGKGATGRGSDADATASNATEEDRAWQGVNASNATEGVGLTIEEKLAKSHGLVFMSLNFAFVAICYGCRFLWVSSVVKEATHTRVEELPDKEVNEYFARLCSEKELDVYTCFSLTCGQFGLFSKNTLQFIPKMVALLALQLLLPIGLLVYQWTDVKNHYYTDNEEVFFRCIGVTMYCYAVWHLNESSVDHCRSRLTAILLTRGSSLQYLMPLLAGELINSLVAFSLTVTLFLIFCSCTRPRDLVLNCLAVHFICDIDNDFVTEQEKLDAQTNFAHAIASEGSLSRSPTSQPVMMVKLFFKEVFTNYSRNIGTIVTAGVLVQFYAFAHESSLCFALQDIEPWPFCFGVH